MSDHRDLVIEQLNREISDLQCTNNEMLKELKLVIEAFENGDSLRITEISSLIEPEYTEEEQEIMDNGPDDNDTTSGR